MAVHGLNGIIKSGVEANTFYHDAHNLAGKCDYVMANPPFNVDKVKAETAKSAGRLPFGLSGVNKSKEFSNANYLWISYFYAYLNEQGRAGFVMAASASVAPVRIEIFVKNWCRQVMWIVWSVWATTSFTPKVCHALCGFMIKAKQYICEIKYCL